MSENPHMESGVEYVGPFQHHDVIVRGRAVPFLRAYPMDGGRIHLTLDRRFGLDLSVAEGERIVPFLADCIAVAMGYSCHPSANDEVHPAVPFPRVTGIDLEPSE